MEPTKGGVSLKQQRDKKDREIYKERDIEGERYRRREI